MKPRTNPQNLVRVCGMYPLLYPNGFGSLRFNFEFAGKGNVSREGACPETDVRDVREKRDAGRSPAIRMTSPGDSTRVQGEFVHATCHRIRGSAVFSE